MSSYFYKIILFHILTRKFSKYYCIISQIFIKLSVNKEGYYEKFKQRKSKKETTIIDFTIIGIKKTTIEQLAYAVNEIANDATVLAQSVESANQNGEQANNAMQNTVTMTGQG